MPRKRSVKRKEAKTPISKSGFSLSRLNLNESYVSLILGAVVVVIATMFVFLVINGKRIQNESKIRTELQKQLNVSPPASPTQALKKKLVDKTYSVKEGDCLWTIALNTYGDGFRWVDIAKANNLENPDLIFPNQKLTLPK